MSFLLRAALVIGVLSYLAAGRQGAPAPSVDTARLRSAVEMTGSLAGLAAALPAPARGGAARTSVEGLAGGLAGGLARHVAGPSADTLTPGDRSPPWRGTAPR